MHESMISGAEEPSAMSVRLETVSFHTCTVNVTFSPDGFVTVTSRSFDVITCKKVLFSRRTAGVSQAK